MSLVQVSGAGPIGSPGRFGSTIGFGAPGRVFVHLAVQEATPSGEEASWFEHVAEDQYRETPELFSKEDGR